MCSRKLLKVPLSLSQASSEIYPKRSLYDNKQARVYSTSSCRSPASVPVCQPVFSGQPGSELRTMSSETIPWETSGRQVGKHLSLDFDQINECS